MAIDEYDMTESVTQKAPVSRSGPGRLLIGLYSLFSLAAIARGSWQIATDFSSAPIPYLLSLLAGIIYLVAALAIGARSVFWHRIAAILCSIELLGVITVGSISFLIPEYFAEATVWSHFGEGYGYILLVLPALGLWWLRHVHRVTHSRDN